MIAIIDYGAGNITSVKNLLNLLQVECIITSKVEILQHAEKIIFPGVGHAHFAMTRLRELNLINFIKNYTKPFLGICLGLQLMCEYSEEGNTSCLSIVPTKVRKFPPTDIIPHMGWNSVHFVSNNPLFQGIPQNTDFYFVHSYYLEDSSFCIAKCQYNIEFCCAIQKDNFWGVQFHPEKSAEYGKKIIQNFINL